jgi:nucleotide-binding universal stress UspA family protein
MIPKLIIAPIDYSENSQTALKYASDWASSLNGQVLAFYLDKSSDVRNENFRDFFKSELYPNVKLVEFRSNSGDMISDIQNFIAELEPDIIILSSLLNEQKKKLFISEVSLKIIRNSKFPALLIPPEEKFIGIKKVVLAFDLSENYLQLSCGLVHIVNLARPEITLYIYSVQDSIHLNNEISNITHALILSAEYSNIHSYKGLGKDLDMALESFISQHQTDILALEVDKNSFNQLISQKPNNHMPCCIKIPLLCFHPC